MQHVANLAWEEIQASTQSARQSRQMAKSAIKSSAKHYAECQASIAKSWAKLQENNNFSKSLENVFEQRLDTIEPITTVVTKPSNVVLFEKNFKKKAKAEKHAKAFTEYNYEKLYFKSEFYEDDTDKYKATFTGQSTKHRKVTVSYKTVEGSNFKMPMYSYDYNVELAFQSYQTPGLIVEDKGLYDFLMMQFEHQSNLNNNLKILVIGLLVQRKLDLEQARVEARIKKQLEKKVKQNNRKAGIHLKKNKTQKVKYLLNGYKGVIKGTKKVKTKTTESLPKTIKVNYTIDRTLKLETRWKRREIFNHKQVYGGYRMLAYSFTQTATSSVLALLNLELEELEAMVDIQRNSFITKLV